MKKKDLIYIGLFLAILLVPSVGMLAGTQESSSENRRLASVPTVHDENGWNINLLSDAGDWFTDHFALRTKLVTANARLRSGLFGVSAEDGVIDGTDGWLYYSDSLDDYLGRNQLSDRSLFNIAHSMAMTGQILAERGVDFLFTVAPNKNTLYGSNMPYYDQGILDSEGNLDRLTGYIEQESVPYLDLQALLEEEPEVLYHKTDSHWDNRGAALAADAMADMLGTIHMDHRTESYSEQADFEGDLAAMLYPADVKPETEYYYDEIHTFAYVGEIQTTFDPLITAVNPSRSGSLVMYRDSFGNALVPFLADLYGNSYFSRGVPAHMETDTLTHTADTVILERAERFLPDQAQSPPMLAASMTIPPVVAEKETAVALSGESSVALSAESGLIKLTGALPSEKLKTDDRIWIELDGQATYEAFPADVRNEDGDAYDYGFVLYLSADLVPAGTHTLTVMAGQPDAAQIIEKTAVTAEDEEIGV